MDMGITSGAAAAGLAVGLVAGWAIGRLGGTGGLKQRAERAERALQEESARSQAAIAAAQASAKRDVAAMQAEMTSRVERLKAEQRAETENLARHLTQAYDELDGLRAKADAKNQRPGDTGHGFAATLPLGDL